MLSNTSTAQPSNTENSSEPETKNTIDPDVKPLNNHQRKKALYIKKLMQKKHMTTKFPGHKVAVDQNALNSYLSVILTPSTVNPSTSQKRNEYKNQRRVFQALKFARKLRHLQLHFLEKAGPWNLLHYMKRLVTLQSFQMSFKGRQLKSEIILKRMRFRLKKIKSIQDMSFEFTAFQVYAKNKACREVAGFLKRYRDIKRLRVNFENCSDITHKGLKNLWKSLKGLRSLQKLNLELKTCSRMDDIVLQDLGDCLKKLGSLKIFTLDLSCTMGFYTKGVQDLAKGLSALSSLEVLHLNFRYIIITDFAIHDVSQSLKNMTRLESLSLICSQCVNLTDHSLRSLGDSLKTLQSLKDMYLEFYSCPDLSDSGLHGLNYGLRTLVNLQVITLSFYQCPKIKREGPILIQETVKRIGSIQKSHLGFSGYDFMSNDGNQGQN